MPQHANLVERTPCCEAPTLTLSAFVDRHQEHLAGALPKFSASRQERRAAKEGEEDFEPSLSYGPVQTPTIFLALHHFVVESSKKTSQGTWRVKVSLYSESTVEFECYSEPLRSEEDAKKQKEVIDMVLKQRPCWGLAHLIPSCFAIKSACLS